MKRKPANPVAAAKMRRRAEARLRERAGKDPFHAGARRSNPDSLRLLHELEVHQVELEMQNAELRQTRDELEATLENYTDLYDFAPVGYFTLAPSGIITQANLTGASLVGIERSRLVGQSFERLVSAELRAAFNTFLKGVFAGQAKHSGDFELLTRGKSPRTVNLAARRLLDARECRIAVVDITERKRVELAQQRLGVMTASNLKLEREISRRKHLELALKASGRQLRRLSHEILHAQEEERKRISRELHDSVLQTLLGINFQLTSLPSKPGDDPRSLRRKIARTRRLVEKSVAIVHRFALELRPSLLDDLGLIPALHAHLKDFMKRTGVRASLTAAASVERLPIARRAVLYRVALEALNNVAVHAQAARVEVNLVKLPDSFCLTVADDGKSFDVKRVLRAKETGRLGLLGMRERLEMIGGKFSVRSLAGQGTTVTARIPFGDAKESGGS